MEASGVTAIIVTHNSAQHLASLASNLGSGRLTPTRTLVIDNGSMDNTVMTALSVGLDVCELGANYGFGAGCNAGLDVTATEYVLFCNPDVRPSPDALKRLRATLASDPKAAIAGALLDDQMHARRFSRISTNILSFIPGALQRSVQRLLHNHAIDPCQEPIAVDYAVGAFILCRTEALRSVGGFDERFFLYSEEEDLSRRLSDQGWRTLLVAAATATHAASTSSDGIDKAAMAPFRFHSLYWYYRRYHPRVYAEFARCALAICVTVDRSYRAARRRRQVYGPGTASAAFRSIDTVRSALQRRTWNGSV
jgi:GT2 family glycosyltransferase